MNINELQQQLFQSIKLRVTENGNVANEVARILDISADSAYRRMRGEKPISLEELYVLCSHFRISVDSLLNIQTDAYAFHGKNVDARNFSFKEYLTSMTQDLARINSFSEKELYYLCKDLPIFHHFHFREMAAFKHYFWLKTILHHPSFTRRKFSLEEYPDELFELGRKTLEQYNQIPSSEIWTIESINSTIRQIEYCRSLQLFQSSGDVMRVYESLEKMIKHLEEQASIGSKFEYNHPESPKAAFRMYYNEVIVGDNSILVMLDGRKIAYIVHNIINYIITRDPRFCDYTYESMQNLMQKSTLISSIGEKERLKFFKQLQAKIERRKQLAA